MDIDQLKSILATLQGLGDSAFIFAIMFLVKDIVVNIIIASVIIYVAKRGANLIQSSISNDAFSKDLMKALGSDHEYRMASDEKKILEYIKTGKNHTVE